MNYTVEQALRDFLILHLSERISAFKSECETFEGKYSMNFQSFERKLSQKMNEEDFAEEGHIFLQKKLTEIPWFLKY